MKDPNRAQADLKKRVLLSNHFGTAFKTKRIEETLIGIKYAIDAYPSLVKQRVYRTPTIGSDPVSALSPFIVPVNNCHQRWHKNLEATLKTLNVKYIGNNLPIGQSHYMQKPCVKPRWREFEDTDDERDYKKKILKYRQWKYSLLCKNNVMFDVCTSPVKQQDATPMKGKRGSFKLGRLQDLDSQ